MRDEQDDKKKLSYMYPYDFRMKNNYYSKFEMLNRYENKIYFQARTNGDIFVIDLDKEEIQKYMVKISEEIKKNLLCMVIQGKDWKRVDETDIYSLSMFIDYLISDKKGQEKHG